MLFEKTVPHKFWSHVSKEDWSSWSWQLRNRISSIEDLTKVAEADKDFQVDLQDVMKTQQDFDFSITPYYFSLMNHKDPNCPIRLQGMPTSLENVKLEYEFKDFPKEDSMMPVPGLTHRYPDRAMLYTTHHCAMYCRFCTRKRKVSDSTSGLNMTQIKNAIDYVRSRPEIREIILSGGDILSLSNPQLEEVLFQVSQIDHIEIIRLGTRNLVTLPFRINDELLNILSRYRPIYVQTHFNHPSECSEEAKEACLKLRRNGVVVSNHTVMLKGVNDNPAIISELNQKLLGMGVQPYYMYHCDLTFGSSHFRTDLANDLRIIQDLHAGNNWLQDIHIPHYMVDTPGGGKIELNNL